MSRNIGEITKSLGMIIYRDYKKFFGSDDEEKFREKIMDVQFKNLVDNNEDFIKFFGRSFDDWEKSYKFENNEKEKFNKQKK